MRLRFSRAHALIHSGGVTIVIISFATEQLATDTENGVKCDGLTPSAQELVSGQFVDIKVAHDQMKRLRDATKANCK